MNWSNTFFLALAVFSCVWVMARIERNRWFIGMFFYALPVLLLAALWATVTASWPEALAGLAAGAVLGAGWWLAVGRRLGRADSSAIKVWGQDAAPKPKAALQAELDQLRQEKDQLEAELRKLKGMKNDGSGTDEGQAR
jgi:hypothetical protein